MTFPRYPKYKDSGVEWLGEVPAHWQIRRLRFVVDLNPSKSEIAGLKRDQAVSFLPMEAIGDDGTLSLDRERPLGDVESGYTYFRDGDVTMAKITPCFENGKGALMKGLVNGIGFGTTELVVARPRTEHVTGPYLHLLFVSPVFRRRGEAHMYGAGGQKRVPDDFLREYVAALPPVAEQAQIADFLHRETAKIDALVVEQRRLMELLKEKRQAVISHAVTKGLNPDAAMKPSGIEWLGDIPAHWRTTRLKHETTHIVDCPHETPAYSDDGLHLVIRTADVDDGRLDATNMRRVSEEEYRNRIRRAPLIVNDIVYSREGERWGHAALIDQSETYCLGQRMMQFRTSNAFSAAYMMFALSARSTYVQGELDTVGATAPHVNVSTIRNYFLSAPPLREQAEIAAALKFATARIDTLTAEAQRAIDLLQERRTALISAAVNGQIDVRNLV